MAANYITKAYTCHLLGVLRIWQLITALGAKNDPTNWFENSTYDQFVLPHMPWQQSTEFAEEWFQNTGPGRHGSHFVLIINLFIVLRPIQGSVWSPLNTN